MKPVDLHVMLLEKLKRRKDLEMCLETDREAGNIRRCKGLQKNDHDKYWKYQAGRYRLLQS